MATVESSLTDGIRTITFNRPEVHNAFDDEMQARILEAFQDARDCRCTRVIILRGAGRSFCAGRDVRAMGERAPGMSHFAFMTEGQKAIHTLLDVAAPVIAAVRGAAIGGGCEFALACDIRIASTSAKFALPEIDYGLSVDQGGSALATSLIGPSRAKWMLLTGDRLPADLAQQWGLVDFVVDDELLDQTAINLARKIADKPARAALAAKALVNELWVDGMREAARRELTQQLALFGSEEFAELRERRRTLRAERPATSS